MNINESFAAGVGIVTWLISAVVVVFYIFCMWKVYEKAGKPGWASIIPIYSTLVMLEIIGRPWWYLLLMFVPVVNIVIGIMIVFDLATVFGKGTGFGFGLLFLSFIFTPILAFGDAVYQGPIVVK
jgi:hypothetical protein